MVYASKNWRKEVCVGKYTMRYKEFKSTQATQHSSKQFQSQQLSPVLLRLLKHLRKHVLSTWCKRCSKPKLSWTQRLQHSGWRSAEGLQRVSVASCSARHSQQLAAHQRSAAFACRLKRQRLAAPSKRCEKRQICTVEAKICLHINSASKHEAGIVEILSAHSPRLHSPPSNALHTENQNALKSLITLRSWWGSRALIILWSTVQVRDVPPFNSTTYEPPVSKLGAFVFSRLRTDYKFDCFGWSLTSAVL